MDVNSKYLVNDKEIGRGHYGVVRSCTSRCELLLSKTGVWMFFGVVLCHVGQDARPWRRIIRLLLGCYK